MARNNETILDLLALFPWWISVSITVIFYTALKFIIPAMTFENPILTAIAPIAPQFAWVAGIFLLPAVASALESSRKRKLLDQQSGIESIRSLSWKRFEELLGEAYRRQGYSVRENSSLGPDGGVDLRIGKGGNHYVVQCKQWREQKVGVKIVREMYGIMTAEHASGAIIVTSGIFTQEAKNFANGKPVDLVEGNQLADFIGNVKIAPTLTNQAKITKHCPSCGNELLVRQAKRGTHAGSKFWGCAGFPNCRYTEEYEGQG